MKNFNWGLLFAILIIILFWWWTLDSVFGAEMSASVPLTPENCYTTCISQCK
jgi:ABC-type uncharacterized transport system permease subunit